MWAINEDVTIPSGSGINPGVCNISSPIQSNKKRKLLIKEELQNALYEGTSTIDRGNTVESAASVMTGKENAASCSKSHGNNAGGSVEPAQKKKRSKKKKIPQDEFAPVKPYSAYFTFWTERRMKLKESHPNTKMNDMSKIVSAEWKALDDVTRKGYLERAQQQYQTYKEQMKVYKETMESAPISSSQNDALVANKMQDVGKGVQTEICLEAASKKKKKKKKKSKTKVPSGVSKEPPLSTSKMMEAKPSTSVSSTNTSSGYVRSTSATYTRSFPSDTSNVTFAGYNSSPEVQMNRGNQVQKIQIYTNEFLEFTKGRDKKLRELRQEHEELAGELAHYHMMTPEQWKEATEAIEMENSNLRKSCVAKEMNVDRVGIIFKDVFANYPLGTGETPTTETIYDYMDKLYKLTHTNPTTRAEVQEMMKNVEIPDVLFADDPEI